MGIHILQPNGITHVLESFTGRELTQRTVQLWCNVQTHEHNMTYGKRMKPTKGEEKTNPLFVVEFSASTFQRLVKNSSPALTIFAKKIKTVRSLTFSHIPLPLDTEMHQCMYRMMHAEENESVKTLFLYARAIDLLILQQKSYTRTHTPQPKYIKTEYDKERMVFAHDYLLTHMDAPPTLTQLAAIAGMNEFKLKRGFKEMFNNTVFGYLADVRLEMARRALQQKQKTITQIAFELGYASLQHFSTAFKKKFGVSPARFG